MTPLPCHLHWKQLQPLPDSSSGAAYPCDRSSHCLSIANGRLLVIGGEHVARTPLADDQFCWALDFLQTADAGTSDESSYRWRLISSSSGSPPTRIAHAQAVVEDKYVYVFGGRAGITMDEKAMNDLWVLDCSGEAGTETWSQVTVADEASVPEARSFHRMVAIGTKLYVFGGCGAVSGRLNDMHCFDTKTKTWSNLGSSKLRGRGGPNLLPLATGRKLGVIAGFAGEETADGHRFSVTESKWEDEIMSSTSELKDLRPRSVCVSASFPSVGVSVIFGGEVDPSARGHEGAGGFANDVVILDERTGSHITTVPASTSSWPGMRGWSDGAGLDREGRGQLFVFGGLAGDDTNPKRLGDLWRLDISDGQDGCDAFTDLDSARRAT